MSQHKQPTRICAFCDKNLAKSFGKPGQKSGIGIICEACRRSLTRDLGTGWEASDWWIEFEASCVAEQNQLFRDRSWSTETIADQEYRGYNHHVPIADIQGTAEEFLEGTIRNIITRLYRTYGYGGKIITKILNTVYKVNIKPRAVFYHLAEIKSEGVVPNADAKYWRDWHRELRRLEREQGLAPITTVEEDDSDED